MKSLCLILLLAIGATPACSHFSKSSRQQRAYEKYVRKSSVVHQKQQKKFRQEKAKVPRLEATEPRVTTETSESPQAASREPSNQ